MSNGDDMINEGGATYASEALEHAIAMEKAEGFVVKDSGERKVFESGMQRDTAKGKTQWSLVADGPMLKRYAEHLTKGAEKYTPKNWMKAAGLSEAERFKESAFRHFMQWYLGETDEDHASATWFNINGYEYVMEKLDE